MISRYEFQREEMLFWEKLRTRLRRVALGVCETTPLSLWMDADDFAHDALIVAMEFYDTRIGHREITPDEREDLRKETYWYAKKSLKNLFISQIRRQRNHAKILEDQGRQILIQLWSGNMRHIASPEDCAVASDLSSRIASAAKLTESEVYIAIARTLVNITSEGVTSIDTKDLTELSNVSANRRRDFAAMLAKKLGLTVRGSIKGEAA